LLAFPNHRHWLYWLDSALFAGC